MNNYVQIRFQSCKSNNTIGMLKHNVRTQKPNYLRSNMIHNKEHNTLIIFNKNDDEIIENNEQIKAKYVQIKKLLLSYENTLKKENKSFRIKKHALTQDSIITLSNTINDMYSSSKITKKELDKLFIKSVKKLEKELNLKAVYTSIHYDEKTPHAHITFKGYRKNENEKWQSVDSRGSLKKNYSKAQDIVGSVFQEIGFKRGKRNSKTKHLSVQEMHKVEKENLLKELKENEQKINTYNPAKIIQPTKNILKKNLKYGGIFDDYVKLNVIEVKKIDEYINRQNKQLIDVKNILKYKELLLKLINNNKLLKEQEKELEILQEQQNELKSKIILDKEQLQKIQQKERENQAKMQEKENLLTRLSAKIDDLKNSCDYYEKANQRLEDENWSLKSKNNMLNDENIKAKIILKQNLILKNENDELKQKNSLLIESIKQQEEQEKEKDYNTISL